MAAPVPELGEPDVAAVRDEIAREIVRVHEESYGAGAREIQVHVVDDVVLVILDIVLSRSEQTLMDAGKLDAVQTTRESFQEAIATTFVAIVERATGRRVNSFVSRMNIDPLYSVELFRLQPLAR
jgi:uncharacterized protein YbcI